MQYFSTYCKGLVLEPLKAKYKGNSNVVFVSVNVDKSRTSWKQGLEKGIYTSAQDINLFTNGLGANHPMVEFYHYSAFPQLLIIDKKGKIISSSPVRPSDETSMSKLDSLIQAHF